MQVILVHAGEQLRETRCLAILDPREIHINHVEDKYSEDENRSGEGHELARYGPLPQDSQPSERETQESTARISEENKS